LSAGDPSVCVLAASAERDDHRDGDDRHGDENPKLNDTHA